MKVVRDRRVGVGGKMSMFKQVNDVRNKEDVVRGGVLAYCFLNCFSGELRCSSLIKVKEPKKPSLKKAKRVIYISCLCF